ncbi:hypothetical protein Sros01_78840 [Streptomyces roseochromogenus]|nr:hypothetical protein Sros01_78840 [Streptomyces roseochromogenus]
MGALHQLLAPTLTIPALPGPADAALVILLGARRAAGPGTTTLDLAIGEALHRTRQGRIGAELARLRTKTIADIATHTGGLTQTVELWYDVLTATATTPELAGEALALAYTAGPALATGADLETPWPTARARWRQVLAAHTTAPTHTPNWGSAAAHHAVPQPRIARAAQVRPAAVATPLDRSDRSAAPAPATGRSHDRPDLPLSSCAPGRSAGAACRARPGAVSSCGIGSPLGSSLPAAAAVRSGRTRAAAEDRGCSRGRTPAASAFHTVRTSAAARCTACRPGPREWARPPCGQCARSGRRPVPLRRGRRDRPVTRRGAAGAAPAGSATWERRARLVSAPARGPAIDDALNPAEPYESWSPLSSLLHGQPPTADSHRPT